MQCWGAGFQASRQACTKSKLFLNEQVAKKMFAKPELLKAFAKHPDMQNLDPVVERMEEGTDSDPPPHLLEVVLAFGRL